MIRAATFADIALLIALERSSQTAAHWSEQQYQEMLGAGDGGAERLVLLAEGSRSQTSNRCEVSGFLVARRVASEWELENIVVSPQARRNRVGTELLKALLAKARADNDLTVFLEVRESNAVARAFYERMGFEQNGHRPTYYADPKEDAILYRLKIARISS